MKNIVVKPTVCAICNTQNNASEVHQANFNLEAFNPETFSARRLPDRVHYRMVKCNTCGLLRSDPVVDTEILNLLYLQSDFNYMDKVKGLNISYGRYLVMLDWWVKQKESLLEIGCGNGFFLEEALRQGYAQVTGIEPSVNAVEKAKQEIRPNIVCDIFRPSLFNAAQFDVICFFQVFDHLPNPRAVLKEAWRILKPGGLILFINHNVEALSSWVMGERSPIIDIEHTYLFSPKTLRQLISINGFHVLKVGSASNTYPIEYMIHLLPVNKKIKDPIIRLFHLTGLGKVHLTFHLGNLFLVAQKIQKI